MNISVTMPRPLISVVTPEEQTLSLVSSGAQGPPGVPGPAGPAGGPEGPEGPEGPQGSAGPQGPQGPQGIEGPQGEAGSGITMQGSVLTTFNLPASGNAQGDAYIVQEDDSLWIWDGGVWVSGGSIQGPPGSQGPLGPQGIAGPQGSTGPTGPQGIIGPQGVEGPTGPQGIQGVQGVQGEQGAAGSGLSTAEYTFSVNNSPPPSSGQLRSNATAQNAVTAFYLHKTNALGVDISAAIALITPGNKLLVQDKTTAGNYQHYQAVSAVDNGSYFTVNVTWMDGGANFTAGRVIFAVFGLGVEHKWADITGKPDFGTASLVDYTISTSPPSGGADGDVWYQVAS